MTFNYCKKRVWSYDMDRMDQVLTNLIDNASRYTKPGDEIALLVMKMKAKIFYTLKIQAQALHQNIYNKYLIVFIKLMQREREVNKVPV